ncbi:MAG: PTS mannitol transporter subunit IICBA [Vallitaleaceae bacterium]|nr:PTS mannitol transporter subunit IICBA [Vallitaleaceae bacterium]
MKNQNQIQRMGRFLSGMVMPNIGAFIAWGLITALFIPTGWVPNENLASLVGPMITYLLPLLIAYTGGKIIYGNRGGVIGAVATMGIIIGTSIPMFIGAMIMGPVGGWLIKKIDQSLDDRIPSGFEMLVNNFTAGILGGLLAILSFLGIGPVVEGLSNGIGNLVEVVVDMGLLPIASILIEPAKVFFLNNAINHGVLSPLGIEQVTEVGKSIFFLLETNPGPGLGILLAYMVFTKGRIAQSTPGAMIIHFFGGIHEIYFPYLLMQPKLLIAAIAGGASGVYTFSLFGAGLIAAPSPGSIVSLMAMTPKGSFLGVLAGVFVSTLVSFGVSALLIRKNNFSEQEEDMENGNEAPVVRNQEIEEAIPLEELRGKTFSYIAVACDAGMGSSAMGATKLEGLLKEKGVSIKVKNFAIDQIPSDAPIVISHQLLTKRAKEVHPRGIHISISDFLMTGVYEKLAQALADKEVEIKPTQEKKLMEETRNKVERPIPQETLQRSSIVLHLPSKTKEEAIRLAGQLLVDHGYVEEEYIDAMVQRDQELSTYIGNGTAIPHGVSEAKKKILYTGISVLQFPDGVDFDGNMVYLVVGIAGVGNEHLTILANLAEIVEDEAKVEELRKTDDLEFIYQMFTKG